MWPMRCEWHFKGRGHGLAGKGEALVFWEWSGVGGVAMSQWEWFGIRGRRQ